jgi:sodium-coupled neutral amino acid transporter 11
MIMGLAGFLNFKDKTQGNVLNNFPSDNVMVNIARFCFGFNCFTTLPLETFVCREVVTNLFFPDKPFEIRRHVIITTALVGSAMLLSLFTCDLGVVMEITGATSACALAYILPPLCFIRLSGEKSVREKLPAWICTAFGFTVMITATIQALIQTVKRKDTDPRECK